ncbi:DUF4384 domain-containing protein [Hugenholtzia roseola]|uniref:DUF4384 domain-containing protein n=1 Tax=Hugenholtzia roseola TaxID=1002 RepID=UPI0006846EB4|nr:DUF4384 domain-containing protein [Hugenholtzia roseola]
MHLRTSRSRFFSLFIEKKDLMPPFTSFLLLLLLCSLLEQAKGQNPASKGGGLLLEAEEATFEQVPLKKPYLSYSLNGEGYVGTRGLPSAASLKVFAPKVGNQANFGTCVGWTSAYAARTIIEAKKLGLRQTAEINKIAFSPGFLYQIAKKAEDDNCQQGIYLMDALDKMRINGVAPLSHFPTDCGNYISERVYQEAQKYTIKSYARLWSRQDNEEARVQAVKQSIAEGNPVVGGLLAPPSLYMARNQWLPTESPETVREGHAVCIVGYDDAYLGGAFEIMNSWGENWGNRGFTWVTYHDFALYFKFAYEIIGDISELKPKPLFAAKVELPLSKGGEMSFKFRYPTYQALQGYASGTQFQIAVEGSKAAYLYVLYGDKSHQRVQVLYPNLMEIEMGKDTEIPLKTHQKFALPQTGGYLTLDATKGKDYLCLIFSAKPYPIEELLNRIEKLPAHLPFSNKILTNLRAKPLTHQEIDFKEGKIAFEIPATFSITSDFLVPVFIEWEHF